MEAMHRLGPEEWAHVLGKLSAADAATLRRCSRDLAPALHRAQQLRTTRLILQARLVTVVHFGVDGTGAVGRAVVVVTPTPARHYTVTTVEAARPGPPHSLPPCPRRLFAHAFPEICLRAVRGAARLWRVDSFLAFDADAAHTLPLTWAEPVGSPASRQLYPWLDSRLSTPVYAAEDWKGVFQRHARYFVGFRTGLPRRQRGRRTRRWTKVKQPKAELDSLG